MTTVLTRESLHCHLIEPLSADEYELYRYFGGDGSLHHLACTENLDQALSWVLESVDEQIHALDLDDFRICMWQSQTEKELSKKRYRFPKKLRVTTSVKLELIEEQ